MQHSKQRDLVEPGEYEKTKIRPIIAEIHAIAKKLPREIIAEIRAFYAEANLDLFTALENNPNPHVKEMGEGLALRAAFLAHRLAKILAQCIEVYINEHGTIKSEQRKKIVSDYTVSKSILLRKEGTHYDLLSDDEKTALHLRHIMVFLDKKTQELVAREFKRDPLLAVMEEPAAVGSGFFVPYDTHPEFVALACIQSRVAIILYRHISKLEGMSLEEFAVKSRGIRDAYFQMLAQPLNRASLRVNFAADTSARLQ